MAKAAAVHGRDRLDLENRHLQGVTEDTPLWDEDDALEEAEEVPAKATPAAKKAGKKPAAKAADAGAKVKKVVKKAVRGTAAAAKVGAPDW